MPYPDMRLRINEPVTSLFGNTVRRWPVDQKPGRALGQIPPIAGYTGWWDAAQEDSVIYANSVLYAWLDLSGSGHHFTKPTNGPAFSSSRTINGIIVPDFDGTAQYMIGSAPRDDRSSCTFVVALTDTVAAGVRTMIGTSSTGAMNFRVSADDLQTATSATVMATLSDVVAVSTAFVAAQNVTASDVTQYYNATSETDANATALTAGRQAQLGHNATNDEYWNGLIAEVLYYPSTLASGDVTSTITWLKAKWGIA